MPNGMLIRGRLNSTLLCKCKLEALSHALESCFLDTWEHYVHSLPPFVVVAKFSAKFSGLLSLSPFPFCRYKFNFSVVSHQREINQLF